MTACKKRILISITAVAWTLVFSGGEAATAASRTFPPEVAEIGRWLDGAAVRTEAGLAWPADPRDPKTINAGLYAGTPGVVLFYLEAGVAARDAGEIALANGYLKNARAGGDDLMARIGEEKGTGLYEGLGGIAFALEEIYKATKDPEYRQGFLDCLEGIARKVQANGSGVEWSSVTDIISGSAGIGLVLLYAYRETGDRRWLSLAAKAGDRLLELGRPKNGGIDWAMDPSYPRLMPNFSHGTAGVAFFLARLYEETKAEKYLNAALAGAKYLLSIAKADGEACLIFHDEPDNKDLYYLGWCHGPVGTANLFYELFKVTRDRVWMDWVQKAAHGLMDSGIPEQETPGFWNNAGICCGLAGVTDFFRALYATTKNVHYLTFGRRVIGQLRKKATSDAAGMRWVQAEHRTQPKLLIAQTGLMQGAAGIGLVLLRWTAMETSAGPPFGIVMPDSAFK